MRLRALVRKEFLLMLRDPHALAVLFIMPTLFLVLMAGAMSNYLQDKPPTLHLVLQASPNGAYEQVFRAALAAQLPGSELLAQGDARSARISLADFSETLLDDEQQGLALSFPPQLDKLSRQHLRGAMRIALAQTRLLAYLEDSGELDAGLPLAERLALVQQRTQSKVEEHELLASGDLSGRANASQLSVPAWLIFGMFFVALPMAGGFQREQQSGALLRFRALDLNLGTLALSKLLPYFAINLAQFALLLAIGVHGLPLLGLQGLALPGSADRLCAAGDQPEPGHLRPRPAAGGAGAQRRAGVVARRRDQYHPRRPGRHHGAEERDAGGHGPAGGGLANELGAGRLPHPAGGPGLRSPTSPPTVSACC